MMAVIRFILLFVAFFSLGAETTVDWDLSPEDSSYQYLSYLFGNVSDDLVCYISGCSQVIPLIFQAFNNGILILATLLMGYVTLISISNSAQQGEFLGKRYSSLWTPAKLLGGSALLVPTSTGYSLLQWSIMKVTLMGVALANNLYGTIANYVETNGTSFALERQDSTVSDQFGPLTKFAKKVYPHELCYAYYQEAIALYQVNPAEASALELPSSAELGTFYLGPQEYTCSEKFFGYSYSVDGEDMQVDCGTQTLTPPPTNICGYWTYNFSSNDDDPEMTQSTLETLVQNVRLVAQQDAAFYLNSGNAMNSYLDTGSMTQMQQQLANDQGTLSGQEIAYAIAMSSSQLIAQSLGTVSSKSVSYSKDWLDFMKTFYEWLDGAGSAGNVNFIGSTDSVVGAADANSAAGSQRAYVAIKAATKDQEYFDVSSVQKIVGEETSGSAFTVERPSGMGESGAGSAADTAYNVISAMTTGARDPLIALSVYGQELLVFCFDMLFSGIVISAALMVISAICSSKQSGFAMGLTTALGMFVVNTLLIFGFLIPVGVLLGIYLPLMPMMMYSFGALHWFMAVVEAIVAGPIVALGFMAPTQQQDILGKASPALMMMLHVFIRPSGMVLGMVFGAKLFNVITPYFTQVFMVGLAFIEGLMTGTNPIRALIMIIYFFFYCFTIVGIANRCFALINALPDRVISWVGATAGQVNREVQEDLQIFRQAVDRSGQDLKEQASSLAKGLGSSTDNIRESLQGNRDQQQ